jgi:RNA polymerase sigma-70 factor (ECF subfamily)
MTNGEQKRLEIEKIWAAQRPYLVDLAFRMLGRIHDAEDVVQEAFSRLLRADLEGIDDVRGWLVVVVSRLCLDQLKSAQHRRETAVGALPEPTSPAPFDPADRVTLDDTLRLALLVVLEELSPAERTVFVLHDIFRFSFSAIAPIVGRSESACRKIASRARRRISTETGPARFLADVDQQHEVAAEFIAACGGGDLERLLRLLDPDVVGDVDLGPTMAPRRPLSGSATISRNLVGFFGPASGMTLVSQPVNGHPGFLAFHDGALFGVVILKTGNGRIVDIHAIADPAKLAFVGRQLGAGVSGHPA